MAGGHVRHTLIGDAAETAFGDGSNFGTGVYLATEGGNFDLWPQASFSEIERAVGVSESAELIDTQYDVQGAIRNLLYPSTAYAVLKFGLERVSGDLKPYVIQHYTGLEADKTRKMHGSKVRTITFSAEKGNPALICTLDVQAQRDEEVTDIEAASLPSLPPAASYEFLRGWLEPRDDQSQAGSSLIVEGAQGFSFQQENNLQEQGRKPNLADNYADPSQARNLVTGLNATAPSVTGNCTIRPSNVKFLNLLKQLKTGSIYAYFLHRLSRLVTATADIAAGATSFGLARGEVDQTESGLTSSDATDLFTTATEHGLKEGDTIRLSGLTGGSGLAPYTTYYVLSDTLAPTTFKASLTRGGAPVNHGSNVTAGSWWHFIGTPFTFNSTSDVDDTAETIGKVGHGLQNGEAVFLEIVSGAVPTGLAEFTVYYVVGAKADTFQLSATRGGSAINLTDAAGVTRVVKLANPIVVGDVLLFYVTGSPDQVECVKVAAITGTTAKTVDIVGRGANNGFRFAWTAATAKVYNQGGEVVIPGTRVETAPVTGGPRDILSQQVTIRSDALAGSVPLKAAFKDFYL